MSERNEPISEAEARRILAADGDDVVEPWEERLEISQAAADDTTVPPPDGNPPTPAR